MQSSSPVDEDTKGYTERYIRWQEIRLRQVSYINNLLIVLASGSLLWQAQSILTITITFQSRPLYLISAALFFISIFIGCWVAWTRLGDFTLTADRLRWLMEEPYSRASRDTKNLRNGMKFEANKLGESTRKLLPVQFYTYVLGFLFITIDVAWHLF
jgi:hypothetical protein